jgi:hypothetical protein
MVKEMSRLEPACHRMNGYYPVDVKNHAILCFLLAGRKHDQSCFKMSVVLAVWRTGRLQVRRPVK